MKLFMCEPKIEGIREIYGRDGDLGPTFRPGDVVCEEILRKHFDDVGIERGFRYLGDGPPELESATDIATVDAYARSLGEWLDGPVAKVLPETDRVDLVRPHLRQLVDAAIRFGRLERLSLNALDETGVRLVLNGILAWIEPQLGTRLATGKPAYEDEPSTGMSWQEARDRMERLRSQGEPYTSQHQLAEQIGCSSGTINRAIANTPSLKAWAKPDAAAPRAQSINPVVTDSKPQEREVKPEDAAAIQEFIENATEEEKAWFLSLSVDDQISYLNDPDARKGRLHQRILGRKP